MTSTTCGTHILVSTIPVVVDVAVFLESELVKMLAMLLMCTILSVLSVISGGSTDAMGASLDLRLLALACCGDDFRESLPDIVNCLANLTL